MDTPIVAAATAAMTERLDRVDPRGGDVRHRDEKDPEGDQGRQRQDPEQAHHSSKASGWGPSDRGPQEVPVMHRRWYRSRARPAAGPPSGLDGPAALLYSARPRPQRVPGPVNQEVSDRAWRAHRPPREATERPIDGDPPNVGGATREMSIRDQARSGAFFLAATDRPSGVVGSAVAHAPWVRSLRAPPAPCAVRLPARRSRLRPSRGGR